MRKTRGNPKSQTNCSLFPSIKRTTENGEITYLIKYKYKMNTKFMKSENN